MRCVCGAEGTRYVMPNPVTGQPMEVHQCDPCRRELAQTSQGLRWIKNGHFCQDDECRAPLWRSFTHPSSGFPTPLWPDPNHIIAEYAVIPDERIPAGAILRQSYCGPDCAPDIGAPPHHGAEEGGDPHSYAIGPCVRAARAREALDVAGNVIYAACFTEERGVFYHTWLGEIGVPEEERDRLMAQWERDRA